MLRLWRLIVPECMVVRRTDWQRDVLKVCLTFAQGVGEKCKYSVYENFSNSFTKNCSYHLVQDEKITYSEISINDDLTDGKFAIVVLLWQLCSGRLLFIMILSMIDSQFLSLDKFAIKICSKHSLILNIWRLVFIKI